MECKICFETFEAKNNLACSHTNLFCQKCLDNWGRGICPYCKKFSSTNPDWKMWLLSYAQGDSLTFSTIESSIGPLTLEDFKKIGEYNPPENRGFTFDINPEMKEISNKVNRCGIHSGSSYGFTMRFIQYYSRIYFA